MPSKVVNALWPFDNNHYYPARIVYLQPSLWFPNEHEQKSMVKINQRGTTWRVGERRLQKTDLGEIFENFKAKQETFKKTSTALLTKQTVKSCLYKFKPISSIGRFYYT